MYDQLSMGGKMRYIGLLLLAVGLSAAEKAEVKLEPAPAVTIEALRAENASLKAQMIELKLSTEYEKRVCTQMDLMKARIASFEAQIAHQKLAEKSQPQEKPK